MLFSSLGLTGICLYFLVENIALQYTLASNVGLLISAAPILTAIVAHFTTHDEKLSRNLVIGFVMAIAGVFWWIHAGITKVNIPILGTTGESLKNLYDSFKETKERDIQIIDFNTVAQIIIRASPTFMNIS
ncbi:MAG TPA: hypothetical protein DDW65_09375 [Firmicutes bacterium]|nr:hypothetical protein [Bacillota bacterium]